MNDKIPAASGAAPADWRAALNEARELALKHGAVENDAMQMSVELYMTPTTLAKVIAEARARTALASPQVAPALSLGTPLESECRTISGFLSDVMTAAGLVEQGKQSKALAYRMSKACAEVGLVYRAAPAPVAPTPAQPSEDARDAARYRRLRSHNWHDSDLFVVSGGKASVRPGVDCPSGRRLDAAVDAALSAPKGEEGKP